jgi:hypothetical protein
MTHFWPQGEPVSVQTDAGGDPARITWRDRHHPVALITRRWRVDSEWWRRRAWRAYYKLSTETGLLLVLYHDLSEDRWYIQRLYD